MPIHSLRRALPATIALLALALGGNSLAPFAHAQPMPAPNLHDWVEDSPVIIAGKVLAVDEIGTVETETTAARKMAAAIRVDRVFKGNVQPGVITVNYQEIRQQGQGNVVTKAFPNSYTLMPTQYGLLFLTKPKDQIYSPATGIEGLIRITRRKVPLAHSGPTVEDKIKAELNASLSDPDQAVAHNAQQLLAVLGLPTLDQTHPFKAEARLTQSVVKNGKLFSVMTAIRNITAKEQIFYIWPCNYPGEWVANNPLVHAGFAACMQDSPVIIKLEPGKAYVQPIIVYVDLPQNDNHQKVTFSLIYGTRASPLKSKIQLGMPIPDYGSRKYLGSWLPWPYIPPVWTNPLTITVTRDPTATH